MSLVTGDLTTPERVADWMANPPVLPSRVITQLIGSMSAMIYGKLNRARLYSQTFTRVFDGVGNMQIVLPDWPVTNIISIQQGQSFIPSSGSSLSEYGYRYINWNGNLPGDPTVLDFIGGHFYTAAQNIKIIYQAGYLIQAEAAVVPSADPYSITVIQPHGIWCRDNGVTYVDGSPLVPVKVLTDTGQYIAPVDATPGVYTFYSGDVSTPVLISYSFIPADLEEACIQMIAERYMYRSRVGDISRSLGGQETIRFQRGNPGMPWNRTSSLPPEVMDLLQPYISVLYPSIGAPV